MDPVRNGGVFMSSILLSMEATSAMPDQSQHLHNHDCHQILYITRGSARVCVNGRESVVGSGSIIMISRFEEHWICPLDAEYERYILKIRPWNKTSGNISYRISSVLFNRPEGFHNYLDVSGNQTVYSTIFERIRQQERQSLLRDEMYELLLQELLIEISRQFPELFVQESSDVVELICQIQGRFETSCGQAYSLQSLAKEYGLSSSYLSHLFKRITGMPVMQYLFYCRLNTAKALLAESALSVGQIVERCGFSDASNFSRTFRKQTGLSPREYRAAKKYPLDSD